jgi:Vacuolar transporter chaperone
VAVLENWAIIHILSAFALILGSLLTIPCPKKWLNNAVFIGTIATTLLNFVPANDTRGLISAAFFTFCSLLAIAYSAGIFVYRSYRLRERSAEGLYYDKYGPTVLCVFFFLAMATNLGLRWSEL